MRPHSAHRGGTWTRHGITGLRLKSAIRPWLRFGDAVVTFRAWTRPEAADTGDWRKTVGIAIFQVDSLPPSPLPQSRRGVLLDGD